MKNDAIESSCIAVWLGSGGYAMALLVCPLMLAVCRRKSPRLWAVIGGLVTALGCLFLSFSVELHQLYISYLGKYPSNTLTMMQCKANL